MSRRLKTPCSTPGCQFTIATHDQGFTLAVEMPDGVDLSSLTKCDLDDIHETIHRHGEAIAYALIQQSQIRRGDYAKGPHLRGYPPFAGRPEEDDRALEIIRRAAARLAADTPELLDDA